MLSEYPFSEDSSDSEEPKRGLFEDSESTEPDEFDSQAELMRVFDEVDEDRTYTGKDVKDYMILVWRIAYLVVRNGSFEETDTWFESTYGWDAPREPEEEFEKSE